MSIKHWPEGERPREKLLQQGVGALSDAELLAVLLRSGIPGMSAVALARSLLTEFGSLGALMAADAQRLCRHKGMGMASFTQFAVVREIGRRILAEEMATAPVFHHADAVADYLRLHLGAEPVEVCLALLLNQQHRLLHVAELARGTVSENTVYVREVLTLALQHRAAALILAHNHPGGLASPSAEDLAFTAHVHQALSLIDIRLLDHCIVTAQDCFSMAAHGCLPLPPGTADSRQPAL